MGRISCALAVGLAVFGCKQGPDFVRPEYASPATFRDGPESSEAASLADLPWWEVFKDPALQALIRESVVNNYDLRIAVSRIEQARAIQMQVASPLYPQLSYQGGIADGRNALFGNPAPNGGDTHGSALLTLNAAWELDLWGRIQRANEASLAQILAAEEARRGVMLTLTTSVARTYIELIELDLEAEIARQNVESFQQTLDLFTRRSVGGVSTRLQVLRAQAALSQVAATIPEIKRQIAVKENALCVLLGRNPGPIVRGAPLLEQSFPVEIPVGIPSDLLQRRPDIRRAEQNVVSANAGIGVALAGRFPRIGLTAFLGKVTPELSEFSNGTTNAWSVAALASGPIFTAGRTKGEIDQAKAQFTQALLEYQSTVLASFSEVANSLVARERLAEAEKELTKQVNALNEAVAMSRQRFDVGKANYFEILDAQQQLFPAEVSRARTKADQYVAVIQLYKALGGGWKVETEKWAEGKP